MAVADPSGPELSGPVRIRIRWVPIVVGVILIAAVAANVGGLVSFLPVAPQPAGEPDIWGSLTWFLGGIVLWLLLGETVVVPLVARVLAWLRE